MIQASDFLGPAVERGFKLWTGVPCSFLTPFINSVIQDPKLKYIGAASEGEAVAIASGAVMTGQKAVMICQNSGLGNTVNPLTSLSATFRIPILMITTHRAEPGVKDEPQHELMGQITENLLDAMRIPWAVFPKDKDEVMGVLEKAEASMNSTGLPFVLIMKKGSVGDCPLENAPRKVLKTWAHEKTPGPGSFRREPAQWTARMDYLGLIQKVLGPKSPEKGALIATTGKIGRELFTLGHEPGQFYMVGSMGCASAIGLGVQVASELQGMPERRVTVIDGDGALLMKLGTLATIGSVRPRRFLHIVLDNEAHESTGAQPTVTSTTDFALIASGAGYETVRRVDGIDEFKHILDAELKNPSSGPVLIHVKVAIATGGELGRPTVTPVEVKNQFTQWWKSQS